MNILHYRLTIYAQSQKVTNNKTIQNIGTVIRKSNKKLGKFKMKILKYGK